MGQPTNKLVFHYHKSFKPTPDFIFECEKPIITPESNRKDQKNDEWGYIPTLNYLNILAYINYLQIHEGLKECFEFLDIGAGKEPFIIDLVAKVFPKSTQKGLEKYYALNDPRYFKVDIRRSVKHYKTADVLYTYMPLKNSEDMYTLLLKIMKHMKKGSFLIFYNATVPTSLLESNKNFLIVYHEIWMFKKK